jgi:hypothetical protein
MMSVMKIYLLHNLSNPQRKKADLKDPKTLCEAPYTDQLVLSAENQAWLRWSRESVIVRAISAAADRVSTFKSDEALCLALLLDFNVGSIITAKNRLKLWEELETAHLEYFKPP